MEKENKDFNRTPYIIAASALGVIFTSIVIWSFWPKDEEKLAEDNYRIARGY